MTLEIVKQIRNFKEVPGRTLAEITTIEVREAINEIKEALRLDFKFIVSGEKFISVEVNRGCCNNVVCRKEHYSIIGSPADKIFHLMHRALNGGLDEGPSELKIQEIYTLHEFLKGSKIEFKQNV